MRDTQSWEAYKSKSITRLFGSNQKKRSLATLVSWRFPAVVPFPNSLHRSIYIVQKPSRCCDLWLEESYFAEYCEVYLW